MRERTSSPYDADGNAAPVFRHTEAALPTLLAIGYSLFAYCLGFLLLIEAGWYFVPGILLLAHSMIIAAFLIHECTHSSLFARKTLYGIEPHTGLARLLCWIAGASYCDFADLRDKHLRHHFERADIVSLDYREWLRRHPLLLRLVELGQWLYLPAVEMLFHGLAIWRPLTGSDVNKRRRVVRVLIVRALFFGGVGLLAGWPVLLGYVLAYLLFITVMGFMDAFQHQYLLLVGLQQPRSHSPVRDESRFPRGYFSRNYEQDHTFSNLLSQRRPWLNLLVLNFCYHNAHHHAPTEPWCKLPQLHTQLYGKDSAQNVVPLSEQLHLFLHGRVQRVMAPATDDLAAGRAPGAAGVSFLTPL